MPLAIATTVVGASSADAAAYRYYRLELRALASGTFAQLSEFTFAKNGQNLNLVAVNPEITTPLTVGQNGTATAMVPVTVTGGDRAVDATQGSIRIVDGSTATKWTTVTTFNNNEGRFLNFDFGTAVEIDAYNFATGNDTATNTGRNPKTWALSGSNNNTDWTILDRRIDQTLTTANTTYMAGFTATGSFAANLFSYAVSDGQPLIVKNGQKVSISWDTFDTDLGEAESTVITPSISATALQPYAYDFQFTPPVNSDTTYVLNVVNDGHTASGNLPTIRTVAGGSATYRHYRYTPMRTRSGGPQSQLSEFAFFNGATQLNLKATNAVPAQPLGSDHTNTNVLNVTVTNPGGSSDTTGATGATRLVDGYTFDLPSEDGTTTIASRYLDNYSAPVVFSFDAPVTIDSYRFTTSTESSATDPVRWILEGSTDGVTWTLIDNVTAFSYPTSTERSKTTQVFPLPGTTLKTAITTVPVYTWTGSVSNDYSVAGNWDTAAVPAQGNDIAIRSGQTTYTGDLTRASVSSIADTGSLTTVGRFYNQGRLDMSSGSLGVNGQYFVVGKGSPALVNQTGGTVSATVSRGFFLSDDTAAGGSTYKLSGTGVLNVNTTGNGATLLYNFHIGNAGYGDVFEMSGGTANLTATAANNIYVSRGAKMAISGGTFTATNYTSMTLGYGGTGSTSVLDISGGAVNLVNVPLYVGALNAGVLNLRGGSLTTTREISLANSTGTGVLNMSGGTLTTTAILGTSNATFNFSGGTIQLPGDQTGILTQTWFKAVAGTVTSYNSAQNLTTITVGSTQPATAYETWVASSGLTGTNATALADPDGDGISNLMEFALNGDPRRSESRGKTGNVIASGTGVLTLAVRKDAVFATATDGTQTTVVDGIRYTIRGSRDLATWTAEIEPVTPAVTTGVTSPDTGWELRSFRLKSITGASARGFMDVRISDIP